MSRILLRKLVRQIDGVKYVSTWSPLATAFNSKATPDLELNNKNKEVGLFNIPELKDAAGFEILKNYAISHSNKLVEEATSPDRTRKMVEIFDELSNTLCQVADMAEFIRLAHPDDDFSHHAEDACLAISSIVEKLNTNRNLYDSLQRVLKNGDIEKTTDIDNHVAQLFSIDFEQSGIHLPEDQRREVVEYNDFILQIGQKFTATALAPRSIRIDQIPTIARKYFIAERGQVVINGHFAESPSSLIREVTYKIFLQPDRTQELYLKDLLNSRHKLAQICGFPSYAHRALKGTTMETPENVKDFLNILNEELRDRAEKDFEIMQTMKGRNLITKIMPWDTTYFTTQARNSWLQMSTTDYSPYFSLGACMEGINLITQALFGVRLEAEATHQGEVWHDDVYKLAVIDETEGSLGHIYCDLFEREGKPNQDSHFTITGGRQLPDGSYQNPIVVIMISLPVSRWSNPCLLSPAAMENLFHEMGHALHSMLGRTKYQHVTGTRCSTDFAEVPSILMEYFASDPRVVKLFARHFQTQEQIPEQLVEKLFASKSVFPSSEMQNQVFYSMLDQVYHSQELERDTTSILADIQRDYYTLPYIENTAWQLRFSHLVGYGAKYYSYLTSRAIASWIWQTYFQNDPLSRSSGEKYRRECLAHGGGKPPSKLVSDFLNKEASPSNFAKSLLNEIDMRNDKVQVMRKKLNS
ncbi:mitochondrial intermediate peptidase [Leptopilina heterotoma]|uniref:mitochondrial intermediate peptidase n=1 Tax=Leptopilina heterotoma TaxID=63436 RepID=UPI001CA9739E|nr:mitochondrial intermediate peptidase [Leptopilina heterotoma]